MSSDDDDDVEAERKENLFSLYDNAIDFSLIVDFSYRSRVDSNAIEYKKFCEEIESIFTTDFLEKNPLVDSEQYSPLRDASTIRLEPDKEERVEQLMSKLAERVSLSLLSP